MNENYFIETLKLILSNKRQNSPEKFETPKKSSKNKLPSNFPYQNPPINSRSDLNQTIPKKEPGKSSGGSTPPSSNSFLEHEATEESSLMKLKSNLETEKLSGSNSDPGIIKPMPMNHCSRSNSLQDDYYNSELADLVPSNEVEIKSKKDNRSGFRSIQLGEKPQLFKPIPRRENSARRTQSGRLIDSSDEKKKEIRSLPKTMRNGGMRVLRSSSPPDNFSIHGMRMVNKGNRLTGFRSKEGIFQSGQFEDIEDDGNLRSKEEIKDSKFDDVEEKFELNLVKFIFKQMEIPLEISIMFENLIKGLYEDFVIFFLIFFSNSKT